VERELVFKGVRAVWRKQGGVMHGPAADSFAGQSEGGDPSDGALFQAIPRPGSLPPVTSVVRNSRTDAAVGAAYIGIAVTVNA
jgi:hypothetical protein